MRIKDKRAYVPEKKFPTGLIVFLSIFVVLIIASAIIFAPMIQERIYPEEEDEIDKLLKEENGDEVFITSDCPDTFKNIRTQVVDSYSIASTQLGGTGYVFLYDFDTEKIGEYQISITIGDSGYSAGASTICGDFITIFPTVRGANASVVSEPYTVRFSDHRQTLWTNQLDYLNIRVKWEDTDLWGFLCTDGTTSTCTGNLSTASRMNTTSVYTDVAQTAKAVGSGGKIELLIELQTNAADKYFNEVGEDIFMCVNLGTTSKWLEPRVNFAGGTSLVNAKKEINDNDQIYSYVSNSQYCYKLGRDLGDGRTELYVTIEARQGQNPASADSPILYFLPVGRFKSVAPLTKDQILKGIVTDASTQVPVVTSSAYVPSIEPQVS